MPPKFTKGARSGQQNRPLLDLQDDDSDDDLTLERAESGGRQPRSTYGRAAQGDSAVARVQGQVGEVMDVMRDNIGRVLQRGEKLDDLEEKSDHLVAGATEFRRSSHKVQKQMWWQSCKMKLCLVGIVAIILLVIIIPIVIKFSQRGPQQQQ